MADTEGGELSEGELEEGEVLSSEDEGDMEEGEGDKLEVGKSGEGEHALGNGDKTDESAPNECGPEDGPVAIGAKRPAQDCDSPNAKVPHLYVYSVCKRCACEYIHVMYTCTHKFYSDILRLPN